LTAVLLSGIRGQEAAAPAKRKAPEKIKPGSCLEKGCHAPLATGASIHRPVKKKTCEACHEQDEEDLHEFTYPDEGSELCYGCHKDVTKKKKHVHAPLKDKKRPCLSCHDPHAGQTKHLLRGKTTSDNCLTCHDGMAKGPRFHKSPAVKGCIGCHDPHASDLPDLVRAKQPKLCYTCHEDIQEDAAEAKVVHGPVSVSCGSCHDPHRPLAGKGLKKAGAGLCMTCHKPFADKLAAMSKRHGKLLEKTDCMRCHGAHSGPRRARLLKTPQQLCLACHDKEIKSADGRTIEGLAAAMGEGMKLHGPLAKQDCAACHEPHGNTQFSFLRRSYPSTFYSAYSSDAYALCFKCHDSKLAADSHTVSATNFRNGNVNLHYVHVNKDPKGRTCGSCHAPHASKKPHMLAESVPFGQWKIPIGFTDDKNGGTCASGCHSSKTYSRSAQAAKDAPAKTAAKKPATKPAKPTKLATSPDRRASEDKR